MKPCMLSACRAFFLSERGMVDCAAAIGLQDQKRLGEADLGSEHARVGTVRAHRNLPHLTSLATDLGAPRRLRRISIVVR